MTIECNSVFEFMETIAELVERGLGFKADRSSLVITLTGAH